jgi:PAS domain S-box-containing protein
MKKCVRVIPRTVGSPPKRPAPRAGKAAGSDASRGAPVGKEPPVAKEWRGQIERLEAKNRGLTRTLQIVEEARAALADQYDFAPIGFMTLDAKGCMREINLTAARMLNRERSTLLTMPFFTHIAKPHVGTFLRHLHECRTKSREVISEVTLRVRPGGMLPVELRSVPVIDPRHGDTVHRTTIMDITPRLRAERALRESEERYRELVELSPDGIFITSAGAIVFANRAALRFCGAESAPELAGHEITDWVRPSFRPALNALLLQAAEARETPPMEAKFTRRDGTVTEVEIAARSFHYDEEPTVLMIARDITRRKIAERHVLKISERECSRFGRDLHDSLCQNLAGAACMIVALRNDLRVVGRPFAEEAHRIADLVRDCIKEARSLAGELCPVAMESSGLVAALHGLTAGVGMRTHIGCALECDDQLTISDPEVATHLYRIAQEAVSNAIRHGRAKSVLIRLAADNGRMTLCVEDDGKGFPTKPKQTGMGLHTMRYRASIIGGGLEVRRTKPRGTIVTCTFPGHPESS